MQTAHEPSYLVKHLLGSLPPVVERVKLMRKGQAPNGSSEDNLVKMAQSQVGHSMLLLLCCCRCAAVTATLMTLARPGGSRRGGAGGEKGRRRLFQHGQSPSRWAEA